jgi:hypothetical protein
VIAHRLVLLVLVLVAADFAVPYEPTARAVLELDDEQDAVRSDGRRSPAPVALPARPSTALAVSRPRVTPSRPERVLGRRPARSLLAASRGDRAAPPSPTEDH